MASPDGGLAPGVPNGLRWGVPNGLRWEVPTRLHWQAPDAQQRQTPDGWRQMMEGFEGQFAEGMERLVAGEGFSEFLVGMTENTVAMWKISADIWDSVWRSLRLSGRADIDRLAGQLARTEDKLERLLQAVERLQDAGEGA
jgi:hypothetical protein